MGINLKIGSNPTDSKEVRAMSNLKFECELFFLNVYLIRELIRNHETTEQIWTEMMLGVLKWDWRISERSERPGFSSFLVTFFFSFHKEKKKVTKNIDMKEKFLLKNKLEGQLVTL